MEEKEKTAGTIKAGMMENQRLSCRKSSTGEAGAPQSSYVTTTVVGFVISHLNVMSGA